MGKRGPRPKGPYSGQTAVLSTRIRPELRAALEAAARARGVSLSHEIEHRLRRTFYDDEKITEAFGSRRNYALMRMIGSIIEMMMNVKNRKAEWLDDPYLFEQVTKSINVVLEAIRPTGEPPATVEDALDHGGPRQWKWRAAEAIRDVQLADPTLPLDAPKSKRLAHRLKADLGDVFERAPPAYRQVAGSLYELDENWPRKARAAEKPRRLRGKGRTHRRQK
jgi:hypothetical protein